MSSRAWRWLDGSAVTRAKAAPRAAEIDRASPEGQREHHERRDGRGGRQVLEEAEVELIRRKGAKASAAKSGRMARSNSMQTSAAMSDSDTSSQPPKFPRARELSRPTGTAAPSATTSRCCGKLPRRRSATSDPSESEQSGRAVLGPGWILEVPKALAAARK